MIFYKSITKNTISCRSFATARLWLRDYERETEYERELETYLRKLTDEDTGALNPHFGSDNLTAIIITQ